jgi:hypothetical protein
VSGREPRQVEKQNKKYEKSMKKNVCVCEFIHRHFISLCKNELYQFYDGNESTERVVNEMDIMGRFACSIFER